METINNYLPYLKGYDYTGKTPPFFSTSMPPGVVLARPCRPCSNVLLPSTKAS